MDYYYLHPGRRHEDDDEKDEQVPSRYSSYLSNPDIFSSEDERDPKMTYGFNDGMWSQSGPGEIKGHNEENKHTFSTKCFVVFLVLVGSWFYQQSI